MVPVTLGENLRPPVPKLSLLPLKAPRAVDNMLSIVEIDVSDLSAFVTE